MDAGDQSKQATARVIAHVIAKTAQWLVLFKPAGWLTIPGRRSPGGGSAGPDAPVLSERAGA